MDGKTALRNIGWSPLPFRGERARVQQAVDRARRQLGLPMDLPHDALPNYTFRVLSKLPRIVSATGVLLGGIYWITSRREEVAKAEKGAAQDAEAKPRKQ